MRRGARGAWCWLCGGLLLVGCKIEPIEELVIEEEAAPLVMPDIVQPLELPAAPDPVAVAIARDMGLLEANELEGTATVQGLVSTLGRVLVLPVRLPWRTAKRVELPGRWGEPEEAEPAERMEPVERTDG